MAVARPSPAPMPDAAAQASQLFDLEALERTPLARDPYDWLVVPGFLRPAAVAAVNAAYPPIAGPTARALEELELGDAFGAMIDRLRSDDLARRLAAKFEVDLADLSRTVSVRRFAEASDGAIHTDSRTKVVTVLLYLNEVWTQPGGRLRVLRSPTDMEDYAAEVPPVGGTLLAFRRADHSWHGFPPCTGERRSVQMQYARAKRAERGPVHKNSLRKRLKRVLRAAALR